MKVSFLFWNLYGRQNARRAERADALMESIGRIAGARAVDVLIFAECGIEPLKLVDRLTVATGVHYVYPANRSLKAHMFTRFSEASLTEVFTDRVSSRLSVRLLKMDGCSDLLLAGLHFHDRMSVSSSEGQSLIAAELAADIRRIEDGMGHRRTILVGDLNMNPFDAGVVGTQALNAVMTKRLARTVEKLASRARRDYRCFYNPMWAQFGDGTPGPPGTHFHDGIDPVNRFWNTYDQLLLRPELMDCLMHLEILDSDGVESLVTREGRPRKVRFSDHLPIFFQLDLQKVRYA